MQSTGLIVTTVISSTIVIIVITIKLIKTKPIKPIPTISQVRAELRELAIEDKSQRFRVNLEQ